MADIDNDNIPQFTRGRERGTRRAGADSVKPRTPRVRSLVHLAGMNEHVDSRGRVWGIRTFRLRELDYLERLLGLAISQTNEYLKRAAWVMLVHACVLDHSECPTIVVRIRRLLGLRDHSKRAVSKHLCQSCPPPILIDIIHANFEVEGGLVGLLEQQGKDADTDKGDTWGKFFASHLVHTHKSFADMLDMTLPQLNAVSDYAKEEEFKAKMEEQKNKVRSKMNAHKGR